MPDDACAIRVSGLSKRYANVAAVDGLSFEVRAGAVTGFLGPNGAGKTTTLRILLGLARPTAGQATIFGRPAVRGARRPGPDGRRVARDFGFSPWAVWA